MDVPYLRPLSLITRQGVIGRLGHGDQKNAFFMSSYFRGSFRNRQAKPPVAEFGRSTGLLSGLDGIQEGVEHVFAFGTELLQDQLFHSRHGHLLELGLLFSC